MSLYSRIAASIVRLVAAGFFVIGILNLALEWLKHHRDHTHINGWRFLYLSIPLWIGFVILFKTAALAKWVDQYLDE
ncbi:MAG TPA: hypothetical protein VFB72_07235 [Verrucomicrobiae bacterium]|nr:hypothetical protein [Verrucomicrobiae bacterium]